MSHLHPTKNLDMAPKIDPSSSTSVNKESVQMFYPPPGYLETLRKEQITKARRQRGAAKGSFTRAFNKLTTLRAEANFLELDKEVDDAMDKLKRSYNNVVGFHEELLTVDEEAEEDVEEEYLQEIETNYTNIQKEF